MTQQIFSFDDMVRASTSDEAEALANALDPDRKRQLEALSEHLAATSDEEFFARLEQCNPNNPFVHEMVTAYNRKKIVVS